MTNLTRRRFLQLLGIGTVSAVTGINASAQPNTAKKVYFYKDAHSGTNEGPLEQPVAEDFAVINEVCKINNITTICIEGWAGNDADIKRGFVLLNGEAQLIEKLFQTNYTIIGLESADLQYKALCAKLLSQIVAYRQSLAGAYKFAMLRSTTVDEHKLQKNLDSRRDLNKRFQEKILFAAKRLHLPVDAAPYNSYVEKLHNLFSFDRKAYDTYMQPSVWADFCEQFGKAYATYRQEIIIHARNEAAVAIIERLPIDKILVVYGATHFEGIYKLLKERGIDCKEI